MEYIFKNRFSLFDTTIITVFTVMLMQNRWITALLVFLIGTMVSGFFNAVLNGVMRVRAMNQEWQALVPSNDGSLVPAIKRHRELFNSDLKTAVETVRAYRDKP